MNHDMLLSAFQAIHLPSLDVSGAIYNLCHGIGGGIHTAVTVIHDSAHACVTGFTSGLLGN
ncbi:hypothetical protein LQZ24_04820 [Fructobacillus sp. M1-13]|uniref:Uncharacterized protein n=1 Tax=Fructobacillus papyriferae TaxID=2713171 RepID=A0ABS5QQU7_9LACO|nr:hypothetical protein [Fructobacillus papyriferae]MBS9335568.1 hypothetical protein [Fructobacillus papyriferae]MCD2159342.1 hypothetical protein [Fructobacillus papyriferae]